MSISKERRQNRKSLKCRYAKEIRLNVLELRLVDGVKLILIQLRRVVRFVHYFHNLTYLLAQQVAKLFAQHLPLCNKQRPTV